MLASGKMEADSASASITHRMIFSQRQCSKSARRSTRRSHERSDGRQCVSVSLPTRGLLLRISLLHVLNYIFYLANSMIPIERLFRLGWRDKPNKKYSSDYLKPAESNDLAKSSSNSASVSVATRLKNSWIESASCRVWELVDTVSTPCVLVCDAFYNALVEGDDPR
jgi:hypothetical protein